MMERDPTAHLSVRIWRVLASSGLSALLLVLLGALGATAILLPQGDDALALLRGQDSALLSELAEWGLTNVSDSNWLYLLLVLLGANLAASIISNAASRTNNAEIRSRAPVAVPYHSTQESVMPERAVELFRGHFQRTVGSPVYEEASEGRVRLVFEPGRSIRLATVASHLGLALLVVATMDLASPGPEGDRIPRGTFMIRDSSTGYVGRFDLASNENIQFFQWQAQYAMREFLRSKDGLGPAVRFERRDAQTGRPSDFWVYANAPKGFDQRHRNGEVSIEARSIGLADLPGRGLASRPESVLLLFGIGLLVIGLVFSRRPHGLLWVTIEGPRVDIAGLPSDADDRGFGLLFQRWAVESKLIAALDQ